MNPFFDASKDEFVFLIGAFVIAGVFLKEKKPWRALGIAVVGVAWAIYSRSLMRWVGAIGADSWVEAQGFNIGEASFYFSTLSEIFKPNYSVEVFAGGVVGAAAIVAIIAWLEKKLRRSARLIFLFKYIIPACVMGSAFYSASIISISKFQKSSALFHLTRVNFENNAPHLNFQNAGLKLITYIGESTTIMNMGLYGYYRNTTPQLSALQSTDDNFLVFKKVFSTHTHTSPSLLEALSFPVAKDDEFKPIYARKRVSLIDILRINNVPPVLYSNQGQTGSANMASSIIFNKAPSDHSAKSALVGNLHWDVTRPFDHQYFDGVLDRVLSDFKSNNSAAVFLHSYAGHGPYSKNIPGSFRNPIDLSMKDKAPEAIAGDLTGVINFADEYDSAISYIDFSISRILEKIRNHQEPIVFLYFSDHGESVFTGRAHDSTRFTHEMARVPFIIFFNNAAKQRFPDLHYKYFQLAKAERMSTLAQLPWTIIDFFGATLGGLDVPKNVVNGADRGNVSSQIVVRDSSESPVVSYVAVGGQNNVPTKAFNATDAATQIFNATENKTGDYEICYHRSNTIAKALRGSLVADCLEFDLAIEDDGFMSVRHPPAGAVGLDASDIVAIARNKNLSIWIDAKNGNVPRNCWRINQFLGEQNLSSHRTLVELPSSADWSDHELLECGRALKDKGVRISYYVHTKNLLSCVSTITAGAVPSGESCRAIETALKGVKESGLFTDISFTFSGVSAIEQLPIAHQLSWNTWDVSPAMLAHIAPNRFKKIILKNDDPNNR